MKILDNGYLRSNRIIGRPVAGRNACAEGPSDRRVAITRRNQARRRVGPGNVRGVDAGHCKEARTEGEIAAERRFFF